MHRGRTLFRFGFVLAFLNLATPAVAVPSPYDDPFVELSDSIISSPSRVTVTISARPYSYYLIAAAPTPTLFVSPGESTALDPEAQIVASGRADKEGRAVVSIDVPTFASGKAYFQVLSGKLGADRKISKDLHVSSVSSVALLPQLLSGSRELLRGPKGDTGPIGPQGEQGERGLPGERGFPGERGEIGPEGAPGAIGPQGEVGPQGPAGLQGARGEMGPQGLKGERGDDGPMGPQGAVGPQGPAGRQGDRGEVGPQGLKGDKGDVGPIGPQGEVGPQGPKGDRGEVGPQGLKGDKGDVGAVGPQGEVGPQGPKGDRGEVGPQGAKGDKGDAGAVGAQGPAGPQGAVGPRGATGAQGPIGPQGLKGERGEVGPQGPMGPVPQQSCPSGWIDLGPSCLEPDFSSYGTMEAALEDCFQMGARICEHQELAYACMKRDVLGLNFPDNTWIHTGSVILRTVGGSNSSFYVGYTVFRRMGGRCYGPNTINPSDAVIGYDLSGTSRNYACCMNHSFEPR